MALKVIFCLILENDERLKGKILYNCFTGFIQKTDLPWGKTGEWTDYNSAELRRCLEVYRKAGFQRDKIVDAVLITAHANEFHPVRDYLGSLCWDGVERLNTMLIDYLHVDDTELHRKVAVCMMVKAVQRIYGLAVTVNLCLSLLENKDAVRVLCREF